MRPPPRRPAPELMDGADVDPAELEQALGDLRRVNRWFGGSGAAVGEAMKALRRMRAGSTTLRVLDVCTGSADIPLTLVRRARGEGLDLRVVATDLHATTVRLAAARVAAEPRVEVQRADALELPFAAGSFDLAMCHSALHHFDENGAARLLAELRRVAPGGVVVTDLYRSRLSIASVAALSRTLWRTHPITRHDSVVSVRAAFTRDEVLRIADRAGLRQVEVRRYPFFRLALVAGGSGGPG